MCSVAASFKGIFPSANVPQSTRNTGRKKKFQKHILQHIKKELHTFSQLFFHHCKERGDGTRVKGTMHSANTNAVILTGVQ